MAEHEGSLKTKSQILFKKKNDLITGLEEK